MNCIECNGFAKFYEKHTSRFFCDELCQKIHYGLIEGNTKKRERESDNFNVSYIISRFGNKLYLGNAEITAEEVSERNITCIISLTDLYYYDEIEKSNVMIDNDFRLDGKPIFVNPDDQNEEYQNNLKKLFNVYAKKLNSYLKKGNVFVHCYQGRERSVGFIIYWMKLYVYPQKNIKSIYDIVKDKRSQASERFVLFLSKNVFNEVL